MNKYLVPNFIPNATKEEQALANHLLKIDKGSAASIASAV